MLELRSTERVINAVPTWSGVRNPEHISLLSTDSNPVVPVGASQHSTRLSCCGICLVKGSPLLNGEQSVILLQDPLELCSRAVHESVSGVYILRSSNLKCSSLLRGILILHCCTL